MKSIRSSADEWREWIEKREGTKEADEANRGVSMNTNINDMNKGVPSGSFVKHKNLVFRVELAMGYCVYKS